MEKVIMHLPVSHFGGGRLQRFPIFVIEPLSNAQDESEFVICRRISCSPPSPTLHSPRNCSLFPHMQRPNGRVVRPRRPRRPPATVLRHAHHAR